MLLSLIVATAASVKPRGGQIFNCIRIMRSQFYCLYFHQQLRIVMRCCPKRPFGDASFLPRPQGGRYVPRVDGLGVEGGAAQDGQELPILMPASTPGPPHSSLNRQRSLYLDLPLKL